MPCVHWSGESSVCQAVSVKPTNPAACSIPLMMATSNGLESVSGIGNIFLFAIQALASNAGPGGSKVGSFEYFSISALASSTPAEAGREKPRAAAKLRHATANVLMINFLLSVGVGASRFRGRPRERGGPEVAGGLRLRHDIGVFGAHIVEIGLVRTRIAVADRV